MQQRDESQEVWLQRQAIELLAQHLPFETDPQVRAECLEELRTLVLRAGMAIDRAQFGFAARQELRRLQLWQYFRDTRTPRQQIIADGSVSYGHGRLPPEDLADER